jgi:hypothetical protein
LRRPTKANRAALPRRGASRSLRFQADSAIVGKRGESPGGFVDAGVDRVVAACKRQARRGAYAPLRRAPELFDEVRVGERGADVAWSEEIDMSADTLWRLAQEQSGAALSALAFKRWRERQAYTLDSAARALELTEERRALALRRRGTSAAPG